MIAYLRNHRQSQAPLGPVTWPNPGVRVHHVYSPLPKRSHASKVNRSGWRSRVHSSCDGRDARRTFMSTSSSRSSCDSCSPDRKENCELCYNSSRKGLCEGWVRLCVCEMVRVHVWVCVCMCVCSHAWIPVHRVEGGRGQMSVEPKAERHNENKMEKRGRYREQEKLGRSRQPTSCMSAYRWWKRKCLHGNYTTVQKFGVIQTISCLPWKLTFIYQMNWKYSQDIDKVRNND